MSNEWCLIMKTEFGSYSTWWKKIRLSPHTHLRSRALLALGIGYRDAMACQSHENGFLWSDESVAAAAPVVSVLAASARWLCQHQWFLLPRLQPATGSTNNCPAEDYASLEPQNPPINVLELPKIRPATQNRESCFVRLPKQASVLKVCAVLFLQLACII